MRAFAICLLLSLATAAGAAPAWPVDVPLTMEKNLPLVQIKVNATHALTFILDSAAAGCVIDRERAAAIGLTETGSAMSSGSGGAQAVGLYARVKLEVGSLTLPPQQCYAFDMKALKFKGQVDGIIGAPLFAKHIVEIDYPGLRMRVFAPEAFRPRPNAVALPLRMTTGPVVRGSVKLRGRQPVDLDMQLDTGSAHVITLCTPFVDRLKLLDAAEEMADGKTLGFGGGSADVTGRIEAVRVGPFAMERPVVRFARQTMGSLGSEKNYSGNLGGEFLKRYRVTFDFARLKLYLEP